MKKKLYIYIYNYENNNENKINAVHYVYYFRCFHNFLTIYCIVRLKQIKLFSYIYITQVRLNVVKCR